MDRKSVEQTGEQANDMMGLGATALGGLKGRPGGLVALVAGALIVESAITRVCPVNRLLGVDTRERELRATGP
ncbi:DUF2892 domain-containing protein [Sorangium sp. So ce1128]